MEYQLSPVGDSCLLLSFGNTIDFAVNQQVVRVGAHFKQHPFAGLLDTVPAYSSLMFCYDPVAIHRLVAPACSIFDWVAERVSVFLSLADRMPAPAKPGRAVVTIPVCYHPSLGNDLPEVAAFTGLAIEEIISRHLAGDYHVYMIGFLPGFAYMGITDPGLEMPRKARPGKVNAGSVGIAGRQTGIYALESFGGWNILGHTPQKMFDAFNPDPCYLHAGQQVKFTAIDLAGYTRLLF